MLLTGHFCVVAFSKNVSVTSLVIFQERIWLPHSHQKLQLLSPPQGPQYFPAILGSFQVDRLRVWLQTRASSTPLMPVWGATCSKYHSDWFLPWLTVNLQHETVYDLGILSPSSWAVEQAYAEVNAQTVSNLTGRDLFLPFLHIG